MEIIYNCKKCKVAKKVSYTEKHGKATGRISASGEWFVGGIWINSIGGGKPTVYGGDRENGICACCGKMMEYGEIKGHVSPNHKCDSRCEGSRGRICECSCGGANHGSAWAA